jgi:hypothetical protein
MTKDTTVWRSVLTEGEEEDYQLAEDDWTKADRIKRDASKRKRALYLRAKKRLGRAQKVVDGPLEKA